jgi:pimeloyl-ACP methyl ester carboxylesterase
MSLGRWARRLGIVFVVVVTLFYVGGGWYFSGEIRNGALEPRSPERDFGVTVEQFDGDVVVLGGDDTAIDDPGEFALFWEDGFGFLGDVESVTPQGVRRPLVAMTGSLPPLAPVEVDLDSWLYRNPADAGLVFEDVTYHSPVGALNAWYVPAGEGAAATWAIHAHGWRADRREAIRFLPAYAEAGIDSLVIEYRNDPGAPPDPTGLYRFGRSEWADIDGAVRYALGHGAQQIVLVGYSTGAAAEMAFLERSKLAGTVVGVVFDSPNLDLGRIVQTQAQDTALIPGLPFTVPDSLTASAMLIADLRYDIGWQDINYVFHPDPLTVPALVFHGDADLTIPLSVSKDFANAHPGQVKLVITSGADHMRSWNVDRGHYERVLNEYLAGL